MPWTSIPRIVLGGVASGVGKTTVAVALARALRDRGLRVAMFKCGPDYLDPTYHARATGAPSQNLDGWMMGREAVRQTFAHAAEGADIALVEGVMGLFDGASPTGEEGSTAEIAKWLDAPVVLVVDAGGMARTIAALVSGFVTFDPDLRVAGVIANRVGSRGHLDLLRKAHRDPPIVGGLPKDAEHAFAGRHLGLHTADGTTLPDALLDHWAAQAASWLGLDALLALAAGDGAMAERPDTGVGAEPASRVSAPGVSAPVVSTPRCRIGLAYDEAFHFYYADNLRRLEALGAELVRFSPIRDAALPDVDGLYLGGGYPEVHAAALSDNASMRASVRDFAARSGPIYAECGGLMYLTDAILTVDGARHPMVGIFPTEARMCARLQALGYVEVETQGRTLLGGAGTRFRGHQFRYSELTPAPATDAVDHVYSLRRRRGDETLPEGYRKGSVLASYVHAHWASNPRVAEALVESCVRHRAGDAMSALASLARPPGRATFTVTHEDRWLVASFPAPVRACSWAIVGGGLRDVLHVAWLEVRDIDLRPPVDPTRLLLDRCHAAGLAPVVGLLTSRRVATYTDVTVSEHEVTARCLATVGLGNALRAGDPPGIAGRIGTINLMVYVDAPLRDEALLEASAIATEAKCAAVLEAGITSRRTGRPATGTGTDCTVAIGARPGPCTPALPYAGKHTLVGSLVGAAVERAVGAGVRAWIEENAR